MEGTAIRQLAAQLSRISMAFIISNYVDFVPVTIALPESMTRRIIYRYGQCGTTQEDEAFRLHVPFEQLRDHFFVAEEATDHIAPCAPPFAAAPHHGSAAPDRHRHRRPMPRARTEGELFKYLSDWWVSSQVPLKLKSSRIVRLVNVKMALDGQMELAHRGVEACARAFRIKYDGSRLATATRAPQHPTDTRWTAWWQRLHHDMTRAVLAYSHDFMFSPWSSRGSRSDHRDPPADFDDVVSGEADHCPNFDARGSRLQASGDAVETALQLCFKFLFAACFAEEREQALPGDHWPGDEGDESYHVPSHLLQIIRQELNALLAPDADEKSTMRWIEERWFRQVCICRRSRLKPPPDYEVVNNESWWYDGDGEALPKTARKTHEKREGRDASPQVPQTPRARFLAKAAHSSSLGYASGELGLQAHLVLAKFENRDGDGIGFFPVVVAHNGRKDFVFHMAHPRDVYDSFAMTRAAHASMVEACATLALATFAELGDELYIGGRPAHDRLVTAHLSRPVSTLRKLTGLAGDGSLPTDRPRRRRTPTPLPNASSVAERAAMRRRAHVRRSSMAARRRGEFDHPEAGVESRLGRARSSRYRLGRGVFKAHVARPCRGQVDGPRSRAIRLSAWPAVPPARRRWLRCATMGQPQASLLEEFGEEWLPRAMVPQDGGRREREGRPRKRLPALRHADGAHDRPRSGLRQRSAGFSNDERRHR